jgi:iron complex outermembrane receptor protein
MSYPFNTPPAAMLGALLGSAVVALMTPLIMPMGAAYAADADATDELQEIVVVGQKQDTNLQKAAESITAITGDTLAQANVVTPMDLNGQAPALVVTASEGYDRSVSIRGIGFNVPQDDSAQPSVSYHEDGIYIANQVALNSGFLDVDHVEILRGPQGTVFGQNSIGGTINVIAKQPTFGGVTGYFDASTGSFDLEHTSAAVNLPLSSDFAVRASFDQNYQHGNVIATQVPGTNGYYDLDNQNNYRIRLLSLWKPTQNFSIELRADYSQARQHETEGKNINDPDPNPWHETSDWPGLLIYDSKIAGAILTYDFGSAVLKSLSSFQAVGQGISVNEDGLDLAIQSPVHDVQWFLHDSQTYTEELDLSSKPGGKLDWIIGGFYLQNRLRVGYDQYNAGIGNDFTPDLLELGPSSPLVQQVLNAYYNFTGALYFQNNGLERRFSESAYGQATYHLSDTLRFTGGLRYTYDHNTTDYSDSYAPYIDLAQSDRKLTFRAALEQDLSPANLVYASVSTGFKPGGGNISAAPEVVPFQFQPETLTAYEIGSKNSFLDKHLTLNLSAFYYVDHDMQYQAEDLVTFQGGVDNIPRTVVMGLEAETSALLSGGFRFDGNVAWEHSRITSHFLALDNDAGNAANAEFNTLYGCYTDAPSPVCPQLYTGGPAIDPLRRAAYKDVYDNPAPSLPNVTATGALSQTQRTPSGAALLSRISLQYRTNYADTVFGKTPTYTAPGFTMTNLYFDYLFPGKSFDVSLAINNLFDVAAVLSRFTNQYGGETTQQYFPQREWVLEGNYRF